VLSIGNLLKIVSMCVAALVTTAVHAESTTLNAHRLAGGEYVNVGEMARFYNLGHNQSGSSERADYHTSTAQIALQKDQREIKLNGVTHWLSIPVLTARGQLWVSALDVLKTIDPVFHGGRPRAKVIRTIVIDPGHGGSDSGTRGTTGIEKEMTLDTAKRVQTDLQRAGVNVIMTRTTDHTVSLEDRCSLAESKHADVFVSIHFNSGGSADGIETYCLAPEGTPSTANAAHSEGGRSGDERSLGNRFDDDNVWLAHCIQKSALQATRASDRGVRRSRFYVLRYAPCPAILIEGGFLSNRAEEQRILTPEYREQLAKAIAEGILAYKNSVEKSQPGKK